MSAYTLLELDPRDKLDALRYLDNVHFWDSRRRRPWRCCGRSLSGRQIIAVELQGTRRQIGAEMSESRLRIDAEGLRTRARDYKTNIATADTNMASSAMATTTRDSMEAG